MPKNENFPVKLPEIFQGMKAVEISAKTYKHYLLKIDYPLKKKDKKVRVIILFDEKKDDSNEKSLWM